MPYIQLPVLAPRRRGALLRAAALAAIASALAALLAACGSHQDDRGPVAECTQYEARMSSCFHRPPGGFASQPSLLPKDQADRERIRGICAENLKRLETACR
jgi:hypothetical protein